MRGSLAISKKGWLASSFAKGEDASLLFSLHINKPLKPKKPLCMCSSEILVTLESIEHVGEYRRFFPISPIFICRDLLVYGTYLIAWISAGCGAGLMDIVLILSIKPNESASSRLNNG